MLFVFLTSLALTAWLPAGGERAYARALSLMAKLPERTFGIAAVALPAAFLMQVHLAALEAAHDNLRDAWAATLPIPVAFDFAAWEWLGLLSVPLLSFGCVSIATAALLVLCLAPSRSPGARLLVGCVVPVLALLAIFAPVLTSSDVYMYVFAGTGRHDVYTPPPGLLGPANVIMNRHIGLSGGAIYGPAWVAVNGSIVSLGHNVVQKIFALRAFNALLLVASAGVLRFAGASRAAQLAFVLNPMLWFYTVLNAHNDIIAIFPCLVAICVVRRSTSAAVALVALAGCIKLPFLVLGMLVFARRPGGRPGVLGALLAIALCLAASWTFGGAAYLGDLFSFVQESSVVGNPGLHVFGAGATLVALGFVAYAFVTGRFLRGAAFTMANLSPFVFPGYMLWAVPYAVRVGRGLTLTLVALPLAAFLVDETYALHGMSAVTFVVVISLCMLDALRLRRAPRNVPA